MIGVLGSAARGRRIRLVFNDPNINEAIESHFDRLVIERSTDNGLTWDELTIPTSRPVLEKDKLDYVYLDRLGDEAYQYRTRYIDTSDGTLSGPSESIEGAGLAVQTILTAERLKQRYLFGLDLTNDAGEPLPDSTYEFYISSAIAWLEHELDIHILPTTFLDETHDYHYQDYGQWNIIQLDNYPAIQLDKFEVVLPTANTAVEWPLEWFRLDQDHGILRTVPTSGTLAQVAIGQGAYLPFLYGHAKGFFPDLFHVDYVAGFKNVPPNLLDIIGKVASLGPFNIFGDLIAGAGIATIGVSIDGLSQNIGTTSSATNAGYGARIIQYTKEVKDQIPKLRRFYKGIRMTVI